MARKPSPRAEAGRRKPDDSRNEWQGATHTMITRRTLWTILLSAILILAGIVIGIWTVSKREPRAIDIPPPGAEIPTLRNPGPWKRPPEGPGTDGVEVEGQGQVLFGTGEGRNPGGVIALDQLPEEPLDLEEATTDDTAEPAPASPPTAPIAPTAPAVKEKPPTQLLPETLQPEPRKEEAASKPAPAKEPEKKTESEKKETAPAEGGHAVQLGAFSSHARALDAWKGLSTRFSYLGERTPVIIPFARDGKTLYRLRTEAGSESAAKDLCARLKVAGEQCTVVR